MKFENLIIDFCFNTCNSKKCTYYAFLEEKKIVHVY